MLTYSYDDPINRLEANKWALRRYFAFEEPFLKRLACLACSGDELLEIFLARFIVFYRRRITELGGDRIAECLTPSLDDEDARVRIGALGIISECSSQTSIPVLESIVCDGRTDYDRGRAMYALARLAMDGKYVWLAKVPLLKGRSFLEAYDRARHDISTHLHLNTVELSGPQIVPAAIERLRANMFLESLKLLGGECCDAILNSLFNLKKNRGLAISLRDIAIQSDSVTNEGFAQMYKCSGITRIAVGGRELDLRILPHIARLLRIRGFLEHVHFIGFSFDDELCPPLSKLKHIRNITFSKTQISNTAVRSLQSKMAATRIDLD